MNRFTIDEEGGLRETNRVALRLLIEHPEWEAVPTKTFPDGDYRVILTASYGDFTQPYRFAIFDAMSDALLACSREEVEAGYILRWAEWDEYFENRYGVFFWVG